MYLARESVAGSNARPALVALTLTKAFAPVVRFWKAFCTGCRVLGNARGRAGIGVMGREREREWGGGEGRG